MSVHVCVKGNLLAANNCTPGGNKIHKIYIVQPDRLLFQVVLRFINTVGGYIISLNILVVKKKSINNLAESNAHTKKV